MEKLGEPTPTELREEGLSVGDGSLKSKTNNIVAHLSGGFDSRVTAALWLSSNINLDEITIKSYERKVHDFRIASKISEKFNFKLNKNTLSRNSVYFEELDTILNISLYTKLGSFLFCLHLFWELFSK